MRRSAAALLARPPPAPSSAAPEGLEAVQAAAAEAMRAVERKFAAVRAAVPSLVLAAPALRSPAFSSSAPHLPVPAATSDISTPCHTQHRDGPPRRALLSTAFSSSAPALAVVAPEAMPSHARAGGGRAGLPRSCSGGDLQRVPSDPGSDLYPSRETSATGECRPGLSPHRAGPMLSRSGPGGPDPLLRTASDCSVGPGGGRAPAGATWEPAAAAAAAAAWPRAGAAGRRASIASIAYDPRRPGEERPFGQAVRVAGEPTRPARPSPAAL
jgi:hypothetical protein